MLLLDRVVKIKKACSKKKNPIVQFAGKNNL